MMFSPMPTSLEEAKREILSWREMHRQQVAEVKQLRQDAKRWQFIDACQDLTPFLREYHSGVCLSIEEINKAMKGGQQ